jgi:hypothetical protein
MAALVRGERAIRRFSMLKIAIIACAALCAGTGATVMLTKSQSATPVTRAQSFQDLHANAHLEFMPVRAERGAN